MATAVATRATPTSVRSRPVRITPSPARPRQDFSSQEQSIFSRSMQAAGSKASPGVGPCDGCRQRNIRCAMNEATNKCYSCDFHRQECVFTMTAQPRKRLREDSANDIDILNRHLSDDIRRRSSRDSQPASSFPPPAQTTSQTSSGASTPLQNPYQSTQHIGRTTELEPLLLEHLPFDKNDESLLSASKFRRYGDDGTFMRLNDGGQPVQEAQHAAVLEVEEVVAPYGPTLVNKYFNFVHPSFPVVQEDDFRQAHKSKQSLSPLLLAAVYALGLNWLEPGNGAPFGQKPDVHRLDEISMRLLHAALMRPHITTIEAGLLLSQRPNLNTPTLTAQLVTAGFDLGLHQDCSNWRMSQAEKGLRKRLAWALYIQDKWTSLVHGRPSHIFAANWTVKCLTEEDFEDAYAKNDKEEINPENVHGPLLFTQTIVLTEILSEILDTFYTLRAADEFQAAGPNQTRLILERAKPVQIKLKDWFSRLASDLKMDSSLGDTISANGCLHLSYFATEITLHRCIIRSMTPETTDRYLSHICRSAAKTRLISAMDFVNRLRPAHLQSFWHFASRTNFALIGAFGILLRATAPTREEADFYKTRLGEYRWTLVVSTKTVNFLDFAVESLDTATALLRNMPEKPMISELMSTFQAVDADQARQNMPASDDVDMGEESRNARAANVPGSSNASGLASPATSAADSETGGPGAYAASYGTGVGFTMYGTSS